MQVQTALNKEIALASDLYLTSFYVTRRKGEVFQVFECALNLSQVTPKKVAKNICIL